MKASSVSRTDRSPVNWLLEHGQRKDEETRPTGQEQTDGQTNKQLNGQTERQEASSVNGKSGSTIKMRRRLNIPTNTSGNEHHRIGLGSGESTFMLHSTETCRPTFPNDRRWATQSRYLPMNSSSLVIFALHLRLHANESGFPIMAREYWPLIECGIWGVLEACDCRGTFVSGVAQQNGKIDSLI